MFLFLVEEAIPWRTDFFKDKGSHYHHVTRTVYRCEYICSFLEIFNDFSSQGICVERVSYLSY